MTRHAVLFDFDGVIADTENVHIAAWERTFAALGLDVPPEECARAAEIDDRVFLSDVLIARSVDLSRADLRGWLRRKQELTVAMLRDQPRIYPGVEPLVRALETHALLAVVTTTWRENVEPALEGAGLSQAFSLIVAKEDVDQPKPAPDAYLLALKRLGVPAKCAVALEDSPTGVRSAREAGIRVVAVGHRRLEDEWIEGSTYLPDLLDIEATLEALDIRQSGSS